MRFTDKLPLSGTRRTSDGYLVADVKAARIGIQDYLGREVGRPDLPVVRVYRPADQVFDTASMGSYAHRPVTNNHPSEAVTADNWKQLSVGQIGDEVARDGDYVRIPLIVMDAETIKLVEDGKRELSAGYTAKLDFTAGVTDSGEQYDAIQKDIRINHVAIVDRGRAGPDARIGDSWITANPTKDEKMNLKTVTVDGIPVETTDQGATVIATLQKRLGDTTAQLDKVTADSEKTIAGKDAEIAKKDAEIDGLKKQVPDATALDAMAQARGDLVAAAKAIVPDLDTKGLSDADIRKAVVVKKLGDSAVKDKSEAYIDARFDILTEDAASNEQVRSAITALPGNTNDAAGAYEASRSKHLDRLNRRKTA